MTQEKNPELPQNPTQAQGLLIKETYKKFGQEALPLIRDVCGKQGQVLGAKILQKLPDNRLSTVAGAFAKSFDPKGSQVISIADDRFQIQGTRCPFGLENTSRELCEAVMEIDLAYFRTAVSDSVQLEITTTVAAGDHCCDTIYTLENGQD
ncbi:L-2-amino-thiazoline-4-carboxylic acid hydrolase [bacterium]|nr:L-2-amino-thiazoline-4-carboxylic acid hydrolase [bacterium]